MIHPDLVGKTAFISGAGSGIGAATALLLAKQGVHLILVGRRRETLEVTASHAKPLGVNVRVEAMDVNNNQEIQRLINSLPALDIAINNAGIEGAVGETLSLSESDYDAVMNTNVKALWNCLQQQIRWFREHHHKGAIVNLSSIAGFRGFANSSLYVASKHAVIGLSQAIALEQIQYGIRINAVSPGSIDTPMLNRLFPDAGSWMGQSQAIKRIGTPSEIADAIVWLCSESSSFVVGHNLVVDGGRTVSG